MKLYSFTPDKTSVEYIISIYNNFVDMGVTFNSSVMEVPLSKGAVVVNGKELYARPEETEIRFAIFKDNKADLDAKALEVNSVFCMAGKLKLVATDRRVLWRYFVPQEIIYDQAHRKFGIYYVTIKGLLFPNYHLDTQQTLAFTTTETINPEGTEEVADSLTISITPTDINLAHITLESEFCSFDWEGSVDHSVSAAQTLEIDVVNGIVRITGDGAPGTSELGLVTIPDTQRELFFLMPGVDNHLVCTTLGSQLVTMKWYPTYK